MNVVVCGKVIPASTVIIEIDANSKRMVRKGVPHELDPMAASAVEEGLRLVEKNGGALTLITMGTSDATIGIRNALAMGATSAVHILDDAVAGSDTLGYREAVGRGDQEAAIRYRLSAPPKAATAIPASSMVRSPSCWVFRR